jgi:hypothetical protein
VPFGAKVKQQEVRRVAHDIVLFIRKALYTILPCPKAKKLMMQKVL